MTRITLHLSVDGDKVEHFVQVDNTRMQFEQSRPPIEGSNTPEMRNVSKVLDRVLDFAEAVSS